MNSFVQWLYSRSWPQLIAFQQSFGSKALMLLPAAAFVVATLAYEYPMSDFVLGNWKIHVVFWGSLLFLAGQAVVWSRRPIEFVKHKDTADAMADIVNMSNAETFASRWHMLKRAVERFTAAPPRGLNNDYLLVAKMRTSGPIEEIVKKWEDNLPLIVVSQRNLSGFERPNTRAVSMFLLVVGVGLMFIPTLWSVAFSAWKLLGFYVAWLSGLARCL